MVKSPKEGQMYIRIRCFVSTLRILWGFKIKLLQTSHPHSGLYAAFAVVLGFRYFPYVPWKFGLLAATAFACVTSSIMSFNDWVDRFHDQKKGKLFASQHSEKLWQYWLLLSGLTAILLVSLAWFDPWPALFVASVWALGLLYSYVPHWYVWQNAIVAFCSASPMLVGAIHNRQFSLKPVLIFATLFWIILMSEVYLDIGDAKIDTGYKKNRPGGVRPYCRLVLLARADLRLGGVLDVLPRQAGWGYSTGGTGLAVCARSADNESRAPEGCGTSYGLDNSLTAGGSVNFPVTSRRPVICKDSRAQTKITNSVLVIFVLLNFFYIY